MSNSNESQLKSIFVKTKISESLARDFRIALAVRDETAQDVIARAITNYVQNTTMPNDSLLKKE